MAERIKLVHIDDLPDILSPQHVADYVGISRQRIYDLCQSGELKNFTIGASRRIYKKDMLNWIESLRS